MDYEAFLTAILSRISIHLDLLRDDHTRGICMRHIGVLLDEGRLGEAFLLCPQCGSVSDVDIDGKNTLQIKGIRVVTSTFETLSNGGPGMPGNRGWKWKGDASPPQTGCSICKASPREAFDA